MSLEDVLGPVVPATYLVLLGIEALRPARRWPEVGFWRLIGAVVFGTYANPARFEGEVGLFHDTASRRVGAMLAFGDVQGART